MAIKTKKRLAKAAPGEGKKNHSRKAPALKKKTDKSRNSAPVLFGLADDYRALELIGDQKDKKSFKISIADHPLDVYRSPFLLDLSKSGRPEKAFVYDHPKDLAYSDLPGGEILEKVGFFQFWELEKSETIIFLKACWTAIKNFFSPAPKINGELPGKTLTRKNKDILEQIFFINFALFLWRQAKKAAWMADRLSQLGVWYLSKPLAKDETVWLDSKPEITDFRIETTETVARPKENSDESKEAQFSLSLVAHEPTIAELLSDAGNSSASAIGGQKIMTGKAIREKYLENNFTRRGVVVNTQKPSAFWPKNEWHLGFFSNFEFKRPKITAKKGLAVALGVLLAVFGSVRAMSYVEEVGRVKGIVLGEAEQAVANINQAGDQLKSFNLDAAKQDMNNANKKFGSAKEQLNQIKSFVTVIAEVAPAQNTFKSGKNLIEMGERLSLAGEKLLEGIKAMTEESDLSLSSKIKNFSLVLEAAAVEMQAAQANCEEVGLSHILSDSRDKFSKIKESLPLAIESMQEMKAAADFAVKVLGDNELKRYLFVFQNDNEMRATGGFMGSFALIDFKGGKIEKVTIPQGGTYDVRAGFNELLAPPQPLSLINSRWEFQDSNWWPDFPSSAKNIKWFYEKSGGPTVDGVFAINSSWMNELLKVTGPIALPQYGKTIDADNYEYELQKSIELEAKDKTKPKKILSELAPKIMERLLDVSPDMILPLSEAVSAGLRQKDIMMYFSDSELQDFVNKNNYAGQIKDPGEAVDYLSVITTNIGGGKTDNVIEQNIWHRAEIQPDGSIIVRVLIERSHFGPTDDFFTKQANNSYIRVYVPLGSKLMSADGFNSAYSPDDFKKIADNLQYKPEITGEKWPLKDEKSGTSIYQESGKTVFANWSSVGPGERRDLHLVYKLPFKIKKQKFQSNLIEAAASWLSPEYSNYGVLIQKQPGRSQDQISSEVSYPEKYQPIASYPDGGKADSSRIQFMSTSRLDNYFAVGFQTK